jgi:hypothetical protein
MKATGIEVLRCDAGWRNSTVYLAVPDRRGWGCEPREEALAAPPETDRRPDKLPPEGLSRIPLSALQGREGGARRKALGG